MPLTKINRLPTYRTEAHHGCSRSLNVSDAWDVEIQEICELLNCDSLLVQQRMWQEVQWQEARDDFKRKYPQFEQSDDREEENVGQKCVWVLWYDESVLAGLDSLAVLKTLHTSAVVSRCGLKSKMMLRAMWGHQTCRSRLWNESLWLVCWMRVKETTDREIERDRENESDTDVSRSDFIGCHGRRFSTPRSVHSAFFILFLSIQEIKKLQCGRTGV